MIKVHQKFQGCLFKQTAEMIAANECATMDDTSIQKNMYHHIL